MATWNTGKLEAVGCDHCGSREAADVITRPDGLVVCECRVCGLAYLNPRPTADRITQLYTAEYYANAVASAAGGPGAAEASIGYSSYLDSAETALRARIMQRRLDWVLGLCGQSSPQILEIGCATGEFAAAAHARGARIAAIDISADAIEMARARYPRVDFRATSVEQLAQTGERFHAVAAFEVIEHVLSPRAFLQACSALLLPGGVLIYSTPNYRTARILKQDWIGYHTSFAHLYFFSDETLARMGSAAGLDVLEWKTTGSGAAPPQHAGARGWLKQNLNRIGLLPLIRTARTRWRALFRGEDYDAFGSGHTLLMAFRKPAGQDAAGVRRAA